MNRPITTMEIEIAIENFLTNKRPGPDNFTGEFCQNFRGELTSILLNSSRKLPRKETSHLFYKATITLTPKQDKDTTKKENYRPISVMNRDANIPKKILANRIQQDIKSIIQHD